MRPGGNLNPDKPCPEWDCKTTLDLIVHAKAILAIHGFMTDGESTRVGNKIRQWYARSRERGGR